MKKVAIVQNGWGKIISYAWVGGCREYIYANGIDAQVYVFNMFVDSHMDDAFNNGELNLMNLPDFKDFDGIILELANLDGDAKKQVLEKVKESGVPVVSLCEEFSGLSFSGIDNYSAEMEMVEHMIKVHGAQTLNFIGGGVDNQENQFRLMAFREALRKNGIPLDEERIYMDTFEMSTGMDAFEYFNSKGLLADAYICANDNIAVGLIHEASINGYKAPDDFIVCGFDNFDKASYFSPRITTAGCERADLSYNAMNILNRIWNGETGPLSEYASVDIYFQESCGCTSLNPINPQDYVVKRLLADNDEERIEHFLMMFKRSLKNCHSFKEIALSLPDFLSSFEFDGLYIVLNNDMLDPSWQDNVFDEKNEDSRTVGYPGDMTILLKTSGNYIETEIPIKTKELIPDAEDGMEGDVYLFSPLHFDDKEVGYMVYRNCDHLLDTKMLYETISIISGCMEEIYKNILFEKKSAE